MSRMQGSHSNHQKTGSKHRTRSNKSSPGRKLILNLKCKHCGKEFELFNSEF